MRKQFVLATALGTAVVGVLPLTAATASTHSQAHRAAAVLTIGKAGGKAVKRGATLQAGLQKGSAVTFFTPGTKNGVTCKKASFKDKVTKNPSSPGFARELLTAQSFGKCGVHGVGGATGVKSIAVKGLPYKTTIGGKNHSHRAVQGSHAAHAEDRDRHGHLRLRSGRRSRARHRTSAR